MTFTQVLIYSIIALVCLAGLSFAFGSKKLSKNLTIIGAIFAVCLAVYQLLMLIPGVDMANRMATTIALIVAFMLVMIKSGIASGDNAQID